MTLTPELITALSSLAPLLVAIGGIATVHYRYRGARAQAVEEATKAASTAFERLFREEREARDRERTAAREDRERADAEHEAAVVRINAEHLAAIEAIESATEARYAERIAHLEARLDAAIAELQRVPEIVREVARLVAMLDPMRTPTPTELARLRAALQRGGVSPSDISGLIASRGVAGT